MQAANIRMQAAEYVPKGETDAVKMFPAVNYAQTRVARSGVSVDGLDAGDWYMPGMDEALGIFSQLAPDGSDVVNRAFVQSGSSSRSLSAYRWVPARHDPGSAWLMSSAGCFDKNSLYYPYRVAAVALLEF